MFFASIPTGLSPRVPIVTAYGNWSDAGAGAYGVGDGLGAYGAWGIKFVAPATGLIKTVKQQSFSVTGSIATPCKLYTDSAGNPGTQVGTDSDTQTISAAAEYTWTFATPPSVTGGTTYWFTWEDTSGAGNVNLYARADNASYGSKRGGTLATMSDLGSSIEWRTQYTLET